ncbi:unnamed protein product, partial [Urochloa humidicola]
FGSVPPDDSPHARRRGAREATRWLREVSAWLRGTSPPTATTTISPPASTLPAPFVGLKKCENTFWSQGLKECGRTFLFQLYDFVSS